MHKYEVAFLDWPINPSLICWNKHINVFYPWLSVLYPIPSMLKIRWGWPRIATRYQVPCRYLFKVLVEFRNTFMTTKQNLLTKLENSPHFHNTGTFPPSVWVGKKKGISTQGASTKSQALYRVCHLQGSVGLGCDKIFDHTALSLKTT